MKRRLLLLLALVALPVRAQPPEPPKPIAPPLSLDEANVLLGGPTRITLHLKDAVPQAVVAELSKQAGVSIRLPVWGGDETRNKPLAIDVENQPFWTALSEVCAKLRVQPPAWGTDRGLALTSSGADLARGREIAFSPLV